MFQYIHGKKGVSPLIATILLIAFAVALGSVVMNWGLNLNLGKTNDACTHVEVKIRNIGNNEVCYGGSGPKGFINFVIDNTGNVDLNGLSILIRGDKGTKLLDIDNIAIYKGTLFEKQDSSLAYNFDENGGIKEVQIIPKIMSGGNAEICTNNAAKAKKVGAC